MADAFLNEDESMRKPLPPLETINLTTENWGFPFYDNKIWSLPIDINLPRPLPHLPNELVDNIIAIYARSMLEMPHFLGVQMQDLVLVNHYTYMTVRKSVISQFAHFIIEERRIRTKMTEPMPLQNLKDDTLKAPCECGLIRLHHTRNRCEWWRLYSMSSDLEQKIRIARAIVIWLKAMDQKLQKIPKHKSVSTVESKSESSKNCAEKSDKSVERHGMLLRDSRAHP
ncbi:MAG: hypothetical protein Q9162_003379 [Coniocarpon cinnabarinum]